jgi:lysozyme
MGQTTSRFVKPGAGALAIAIALGGAYEGTRLVAYHDPGNGTPTICTGETHGVFMGMTKTLAECNAMFSGSMGQRVDFVRPRLKQKQPETRIAALADFAYNEGEGTLLNSTAWREINVGNIVQGCNALMNYTTAAKKHLAGLKDRRCEERVLCLIGTDATVPLDSCKAGLSGTSP